MRKYKAPGIYANFNPTTDKQISTFEQERILAIVGTGQQTFERTNVLIKRNNSSITDQLPDKNVVAIDSVSTNPITSKADLSNKFYTNYKLINDAITWTPLSGPQYEASVSMEIGKGDQSFLENFEYEMVDKSAIITETYKFEVINVGPSGVGTYMVTRMSTGDIIGQYVTDMDYILDIIPGLKIKVLSTVGINDDVSMMGDYVLLKTKHSKCHVDPTFEIDNNKNSINEEISVKDDGSHFNMTGNNSGDTDVSKLPRINNQLTINKELTGLKFQISLYKNGVLTNCEDILDKLSVSIEGTVTGMPIKNSIDLYESPSVGILGDLTGIVSSNMYDITEKFTLSTMHKSDVFDLSYIYMIKDDEALNNCDIVIQLDVIKEESSEITPKSNKKLKIYELTKSNKILVVNNGIFVRNNVVPHKVNSTNEIFGTLFKNVKIINKSLITTNNYSIKISDLSKNEITIFDMNGNKTIGTWSTDNINVFRNAIPGLSFELYSLKDIEGLISMNGSKDINDLTGSGIVIDTVAGIINPRTPQNDDEYYVSYKYSKTDNDYEPKVFAEYKDVVREYGKYLTTTSGVIINPLSLAAEIAMQNGASPLVIVQAKADTDDEFKVAIDKLGKKIGSIDSINAIVALTSSREVNKYLINHINKYSSSEYGMYRMAYLSSLPNEPVDKIATAIDAIQGSIQTAQDINDERIVYVVPGLVTRNVTNSTTGYSSVKALPGYFLTTAVAALAMKNDPAEPLTNKKLMGFSGLVNHYSEPELNLLSASGCLAVKQEANVIKVRHGVTTHGAIDTLADIQSNEITLVQIKDFVINGCKKSIGENYIGGKLKPSIVSDIEFTIKSLLGKYINDNIIIGYENLIVRRDLDDPRQLNVNFLIEAVYPLNYINIEFGFSTTIS